MIIRGILRSRSVWMSHLGAFTSFNVFPLSANKVLRWRLLTKISAPEFVLAVAPVWLAAQAMLVLLKWTLSHRFLRFILLWRLLFYTVPRQLILNTSALLGLHSHLAEVQAALFVILAPHMLVILLRVLFRMIISCLILDTGWVGVGGPRFQWESHSPTQQSFIRRSISLCLIEIRCHGGWWGTRSPPMETLLDDNPWSARRWSVRAPKIRWRMSLWSHF